MFYLTTNRHAGICPTGFRASLRLACASQSGPLLVNGQINPAFTPGSANVLVRNGMGLLPDGKTGVCHFPRKG